MSDSEGATSKATGNAQSFTDRELELLGFAMRSLKSGPPEIDYHKLAAFAGFTNYRSASNAWAGIKKKLMADGPADVPADGSSSPQPAKASTPRKKPTAKAKHDAEAVDGSTEGTPKKTTRKRTAKKQDVDGDASPKKKGRAARPKKAPEERTNTTSVKAEEKSDSEDALPNVEEGVENGQSEEEELLV